MQRNRNLRGNSDWQNNPEDWNGGLLGHNARELHDKHVTPFFVALVPGTGVEPVQAEARGILSPLRLPIPPPGHEVKFISGLGAGVNEACGLFSGQRKYSGVSLLVNAQYLFVVVSRNYYDSPHEVSRDSRKEWGV